MDTRNYYENQINNILKSETEYAQLKNRICEVVNLCDNKEQLQQVYDFTIAVMLASN